MGCCLLGEAGAQCRSSADEAFEVSRSRISFRVATAAAIGAAASPNEPVTKMLVAAVRRCSAPSTAEVGWQFAKHLPQQLRSGRTPSADQLQSSASRKPVRTSSMTNSAPVSSHSRRAVCAHWKYCGYAFGNKAVERWPHIPPGITRCARSRRVRFCRLVQLIALHLANIEKIACVTHHSNSINIDLCFPVAILVPPAKPFALRFLCPALVPHAPMSSAARLVWCHDFSIVPLGDGARKPPSTPEQQQRREDAECCTGQGGWSGIVIADHHGCDERAECAAEQL